MDIFSLPHLIILLLIVMALFGTSKLKNTGADLGSAIKSFRQAMKEEKQLPSSEVADTATQSLEHTREMKAIRETAAETLHTNS